MKESHDRSDDPIGSARTEFIGGPYDGYKVPTFTERDQLAAEVVWLVCEDAFRLINGKAHRPGGTFTSVALYALEEKNGMTRYQFARAISVNQLLLARCLGDSEVLAQNTDHC